MKDDTRMMPQAARHRGEEGACACFCFARACAFSAGARGVPGAPRTGRPSDARLVDGVDGGLRESLAPVAQTEAGYVARALALLRGPAELAGLRAAIRARRHRLFNDAASVGEWARFLGRVAG